MKGRIIKTATCKTHTREEVEIMFSETNLPGANYVVAVKLFDHVWNHCFERYSEARDFFKLYAKTTACDIIETV